MTETIVYTVPVDLGGALTANQRQCWQERARRASDLRTTGVLCARRALIPLVGKGFTRAHLTVTIAWPDRRRRDPANWHPTIKALVDGAVDAGMIPDDDGAHLVGPDLRVSDELSGQPRVALLTFSWERVRLWTCAVCAKTSTWGEGWSSYGSVRVDEQCGHRVVLCSPQCRATPQAAQLVSQWDADHHYARNPGRCRAGGGG